METMQCDCPLKDPSNSISAHWIEGQSHFMVSMVTSSCYSHHIHWIALTVACSTSIVCSCWMISCVWLQWLIPVKDMLAKFTVAQRRNIWPLWIHSVWKNTYTISIKHWHLRNILCMGGQIIRWSKMHWVSCIWHCPLHSVLCCGFQVPCQQKHSYNSTLTN